MRRVRGIVFIFCALSIGAAGLPQTTGPMLTVPTIRIDVIAPTAVRLTADTPPGQRVYQIAVRKRREGTESALTAMPLSGESYKGTHWTGLDTVEPASTYRYQVMAESGTTRPSNSEWSADVIVRTPAPPASPPAAPRSLTVKPLRSFQVELAWQDRANNEYGFEILEIKDGGRSRIALANPDTTRFVLHGRTPGSASTYVVRAFNPRGVSAETPAVSVTLPPFADAPRTPDAPPQLEPCRTPEQAVQDVEEAGDDDRHELNRALIQRLGGAFRLELLPLPGTCGNANCNWFLYGEYGGCYRKLGETFGAGYSIVASLPDGTPLILQSGHMSAFEASVALYTVRGGSLVELDSFSQCNNPQEPLTELHPVFEACQFEGAVAPERPR